MGEIFRAFHVGGLQEWPTQSVGSGQSITHTNTPKLGGVPGDLKVNIVNQNAIYKVVSGLDFSVASMVKIRFYVDSSVLTMTADGLFSLVALKATGVSHRLGCAYGSTSGQHYLLFQKIEDGGAATSNNTVNISAGRHYLELALYKASSGIAGDGKAIYYVDGVEVARRENLDIYDDFATLSELRFGPSSSVSPLDVGTSGSIILGKLTIRSDNTYIGPIGGQQLASMAMPINHTDGWTAVVANSGQTAAHDLASYLGGQRGDMQVTISTTNTVYGEFVLPGATLRYGQRTYQNFDGLTMADGDKFAHTDLTKSGGSHRASVGVEKAVGVPIRYVIEVTDDTSGLLSGSSGAVVFTGNQFPVPSGKHFYEVYVQRSASTSAKNGTLDFYVNGVLRTTVRGWDNYASWGDMDRVRIGAPSGLDVGTTGTFVQGKVVINNHLRVIGGLGPLAFKHQVQMRRRHTINRLPYYIGRRTLNG